MSFDITTFIFEIINFLVLLWILQRFFYKPVLSVINERKRYVEKTLQAADDRRLEAEALEEKYRNRLQKWEEEKTAAKHDLYAELDAERAKQMQTLQIQLNAERQKAEVAGQRRLTEQRKTIERQALQQAAQFASLILHQAAGPELEMRLFMMLLEQLKNWNKKTSPISDINKVSEIDIKSAHPLQIEQKQELELVLNNLIGRRLQYHYQLNAELIAGIQVTIGSWLIHADLQHELEGFTAFAGKPL